MKNITKRELTLIVVLSVVIILAAYYNFFLKGNMDKSSSLDIETGDVRSALNDAKLKTAAVKQTQEKIDLLNVEIEEFQEFILPGLDRPELIRLFDRSLYPYITDSVVTFTSTYRDLGPNYVYVINLSFNTQQENFTKILENLKNEKILNRVVSSNITIIDYENSIISVGMSIEILTQNNPMVSFKTEVLNTED